MPRLLILFPVLFHVFLANAQKPYFQQEVHYTIRAVLHDSTHTLTGTVDIVYVNHSSDELGELWMHLWANAYKNRNTDFAKQQLKQGNSRFYFAEDADLGFFKGLSFTVDGRAVNWKPDRRRPDIARLLLPKPLPPGGKVVLSTPFELKIPASFSRLGHVGTSYQLTQWYPKPAVYDNEGWHPMPYLDQGEFYSEFGTFDVTLTLPANYVVGATGTLETPSEIDFLREKELETREWIKTLPQKTRDTFPPSAKTLKTIRFKAQDVHDFAWFADKRFRVLKDTALVADGRAVACWAMFTQAQSNIWKNAHRYVRRAVEFYSEKVGPYPWPQATAVHSALSAGGGMEYPMITVIGNSQDDKSLDEVITHEVGHNWFYGILASNERDHPWLDEGINSYYEDRYMRTYYKGVSFNEMLPAELLNPRRYGTLPENGCLLLAREHQDVPPDSPSDTFSTIGYGLQVYMKPAFVFAWLEKAVGTEKLDMAMHRYFQEWKFRHPKPADLFGTLRNAGIEANWVEQQMTTGAHADPALRRVSDLGKGRYKLTLENRGAAKTPFPVSALREGAVIATQWIEPTKKERWEIVMEAPGATAFNIDDNREILDVRRRNNMRRTHGLFPGWEMPIIRPYGVLQHNRKSLIGVLPWLGWNNYDKTMAGLAFFNPPMPTQRLQYFLLPGYGFGSKKAAGLADVRLHLFPGGLIPRLTIGVSAKSFQDNYISRYDYFTRFYRVAPEIRAELRDRSYTFRHYLKARVLFIGQEKGVFEQGVLDGKTYARSTIYELGYEGVQKRLPNPFAYKVAVEHQAYTVPGLESDARYWRGTLEFRQHFYYQPKRRVTARFFAGFFLENTRRNAGAVSNELARASLALNPQGFNDYRFDQVFLGRSEQKGFLSRQVSQTEGGFKAAFGSPYALRFGNTNNYLYAVNLRADLPKRLPLGLPLKPYVDLGYADDATPLQNLGGGLVWSGGLMLEFLRGGLEVYFPLVNSAALRDLYGEYSGGKNKNALFYGGNYWKWITWSVRLNELTPENLRESLLNN